MAQVTGTSTVRGQVAWRLFWGESGGGGDEKRL